MGVIQCLVGGGEVAPRHVASGAGHQLERAGVLSAQLVGLPVVAAPCAGGAILKIGPARIEAIAPAAVLDGALGIVELLALEGLVYGCQDEA